MVKNNIRVNPSITENGLTIRELKDIINGLPDKNDWGEDYEVWVGTGDNLSNIVKSVCALNKRNSGCDLLLEI